jgi:UDP-GlcNAc:undecaprenyl-phosphate/decaprenyl-phosphate GlcNAc-1-phosphate transferase
MTTLGALVVGLVAGAVFLHLLRPVLASPYLERLNFRERRVPTAGGLVAVIASMFGVAAWWFLHPDSPAWAVLSTVLGFGLLGFVDDVLAAGSDRGFAGHLSALAHGRLTTGGLKLLGGAAVGVLAAVPVDGGQHARVLADAVLIALAANAGNLFDRAPGRTLKVGAVALAVIVAIAPDRSLLVGPLVVVGAFLALAPFDLGERLMLGDTGANALGGVIGLSLLLTVAFRTRMVLLLVLLLLNTLSEVVSFSEVIDRVPPLRWVDRAGRTSGYPEIP